MTFHEYWPMREFDFQTAQWDAREAMRLASVRDRVSEMLTAGRGREAVDVLTAEMPLVTQQRWDDERYRIYASYELALLCLATFRWEQGRKLIESAGLPASGDWPILPFDSFCLLATRLREIHAARLGANAPALPIVAMPKSASAYLSASISELLSVPVLRMSILDCVVPGWVRQVCSGGCTTHEHFAARPDNVRAMIDAGCKRLFVQLRDPRAAAFSQLHDALKANGRGAKGALDWPRFVPLTARRAQLAAGWLETRRRTNDTGVIELVLVLFQELVADPTRIVFRILTQGGTGVHRRTVDDYFAARASQNRMPENFREGDDDAWRKFVSPSVRNELWETIPEIVRSELRLER